MSLRRYTLTLAAFEARVREYCDKLVAKEPGTSVRAAFHKLCGLIHHDPARQEQQYRVLRGLVQEATRDENPAKYTTLVAVHDILLRDKAFQPPGEDSAYLQFFDEDFYLDRYPDIAGAIDSGLYEDGFQHFVDEGAIEGRAGHPWRATTGAMPGTATSNGADEWGRVVDQPKPKKLLARVASLFGKPTKYSQQTQRALGINLIGYHSGNLGYGVTARHYYRFFREAGLDVCPIDLPLEGRNPHDTTYADEFLHLDAIAPHPVNFFVLNGIDLDNHIKIRHTAVRTENKINVALPFWELPRLPEPWVKVLNRMDILIAASGFVKHALMMDVTGPIIRDLRHPIYLPEVIVDRKRWDIPDGATAFVCSFEMASDINRKNPFAAIRAFEQALGQNKNALLIVKVNNPSLTSDFAPHLQELKDAARRTPNIRILDRVLPYADVLSLFASCDVFVSLHRAEGLGLCLMEAMTLGKPVIATSWSGNMAFTNEQNSCLVGYDLVPVKGSTQVAYAPDMVREGASWADANIDHAAHWMERLVRDPALRERIGQRAAADMVKYQKSIDVDEFVASVRNLAERRGISLAHGS